LKFEAKKLKERLVGGQQFEIDFALNILKTFIRNVAKNFVIKIF